VDLCTTDWTTRVRCIAGAFRFSSPASPLSYSAGDRHRSATFSVVQCLISAAYVNVMLSARIIVPLCLQSLANSWGIRGTKREQNRPSLYHCFLTRWLPGNFGQIKILSRDTGDPTLVKENSWTLLYEPRDTPVALTHPMSTPYSSCGIRNTLFHSMKTEPAFKRYTSVTHQCLAVLTFNLIWPNGDPHGSLRIKTNFTEIMSGLAYWLFCALEICRVTERHWIKITFAL
jgi:hypothetical protein